MKSENLARGRLRIGDDWNAITIIALSQSSPLKAIAELVENSIDAKAHSVTITRGREGGRHFLAIRDDGEGLPRDAEGRPDVCSRHVREFHVVRARRMGYSSKRLVTKGKSIGCLGQRLPASERC